MARRWPARSPSTRLRPACATSGVLPLARRPSTVALIGAAARDARARRRLRHGLPAHVVTPLDGLAAALPGRRLAYAAAPTQRTAVAEVTVRPAAATGPASAGHRHPLPATPTRGLVATTPARRARRLDRHRVARRPSHSVELERRCTPRRRAAGRSRVGFEGRRSRQGPVDGTLVVDGASPHPRTTDPRRTLMAPPTAAPRSTSSPASRSRSALRHRPGGPHPRPLVDAVAAFATDPRRPTPTSSSPRPSRRPARPTSRVVVVGTTDRVESEGFDREDLAAARPSGRAGARRRRRQPAHRRGRQRRLPGGAAVARRGRRRAAGWFPGQEGGAALADVLLGRPSRAAGCPRPGGAPRPAPVSPSRSTANSRTPRACTSATAAACAGGAPRRTGSGTGSATPTTSWRYEDLAVHDGDRSRSRAATPATAPAARSCRSTCPARTAPSTARCAGWPASRPSGCRRAGRHRCRSACRPGCWPTGRTAGGTNPAPASSGPAPPPSTCR